MQFIKNITLFICALCFGVTVRADMPPAASSQYWDAASQGFRGAAKVAILDASKAPTQLKRDSTGTAEKIFTTSLLNNIDDSMSMEQTRILLISKDKNIILEKYAASWLKHATPVGFSMSKSLTSLAVGKLLCKNPAITLNTKGGEILPEFKGASWGNSTLQQILSMQSGSSISSPPYSGWQTEAVAAKHRGLYDGSNNIDLTKEMIADDARANNPGASYQYNNYDTIFLGLIVEAISKKPFHKFFDEEIWQDVKSEKTGGWLVNNTGNTYTAMGFSASPEDWLRVGYYVIDNLKKDDCFGNYLKSAAHITHKTHTPVMCYGYQIWNFCRPDVFQFLGFGGQYLLIIPSKNSVIYGHSARRADDRNARDNALKRSLNIIQAIQTAP